MIQKTENTNNIRIPKVLTKIFSCIVILFIAFNCIASSLAVSFNSVDLSEISVIQKDIFSAVFLISGTIEKINFSLASKLGLCSDADNSGKENKLPVTPCKYNDIIITTAQTQNFKVIKAICGCYNAGISYDGFCGIYYLFYLSFLSQINIVYFLVLLLFFASAKKMYDIYKIINITMFKPTVV